MPETERTRTTPGMPFIAVSIGKRDELFDLLRREAFRLGQDGDGRPVQVREYVDRDARQHEQAVGDQNGCGREHEQAIAQAVRDDEA